MADRIDLTPDLLRRMRAVWTMGADIEALALLDAYEALHVATYGTGRKRPVHGGPAVTAADDARQAMTRRGHSPLGLDAPMPDGRTIGQHLDDGATAKRLVRGIAEETIATSYDADENITIWDVDTGGCVWAPIADVDPDAAALLARLADR